LDGNLVNGTKMVRRFQKRITIVLLVSLSNIEKSAEKKPAKEEKAKGNTPILLYSIPF
jgi:hypothetical protein